MFRWRAWLLLWVWAACGTVLKPPEPDRRFQIRTDAVTFMADRGYRFVVLPEPRANVVRLDVRYPVGSIDDPVGKEGLAHLVEHLLTELEVVRDNSKTSLDGELERVALSYNAHTTTDATTYEALALPSAIEDLMWVEARRMTTGCAGIPRALFEREREVVRNELRERGSDGAEMLGHVYETLYPPGHPYRRVDSTETVANITYEDVCAFLVGPYRRGIPIVTISGAVDVPGVQRAVADQFAHVPKRLPAVATQVPIAPPQPGTTKLRGPVDEPTLLITWPLPPQATPEYRLLELAWFRIARYLETYAFIYHWGHSASTTLLGGPRAPVLAISIVLRSTDDLDEAKQRVDSAMRDTLYSVARPDDDRTSAGWVRTWESAAERLLARWDSLAGRDELAANLMQYEPTGSVVGRVKELQAATPKQTRALAEKWFSTARARFILIEPNGASSVGQGGVFRGIVEQHGARVDAALADRPLPRPPHGQPIHIERYRQGNGLSVVFAPRSMPPIVEGRLVVDAGSSDDPLGQEGVSSTVGADDIYEDAMVFEDQRLSIRVDDLIRALGSEIRFPGYGLDDDQKKYLIARLEQPRVVERARYRQDILVALYGKGHPYARNPISAAGVRHLSHDVVQSWAKRHITPRNSTLVVVGAFDPALIKRYVAYNTDQVDSGSHTADVEAMAHTTPSFLYGTTAKTSPTVELAAYFVGGRGIDRDHAKRLVLEAVLDARFAELRQQRAITYGFSASYAPRRGGGLWTISGEVDAARAAEAGTAMMSILDELRRDPDVARAAFVLARQKVLESLLVTTTSTANLADRLATLARFDLPDDFFDRTADAVADLTWGSFRAFVATELVADHQVFGAFGNVNAARAAASAARAAATGARPRVDVRTPPPAKPEPAKIEDPFR